MKKVFLAGATGSIGKNVFYCIEHLNKYYLKNRQHNHQFQITGLAIRGSRKALLHSLKYLKKNNSGFKPPKVLVSSNSNVAKALQKDFPQARIFTSILEAVEATDFDIMINALSGSIGLHATIPALKKGKKILLANKESLVMAGALINRISQKTGSEIIPIDSEHSALYQLISPHGSKKINRLILTASGGPFFRNYKKNPTVEEALKHPNWSMGKKISIDSATMMNKGLEVIEAHHLFGFGYDKIEVIIHPQSLVHSLVETIDGVQYAQLGSTDMRHPIFSALSHPELLSHNLKLFNLYDHGNLEFYRPDFCRFPMLELAYQCGKKEIEDSRNYAVIMNAANEEAVELFLEKRISFSKIYTLTHSMVENYQGRKLNRIDQIQDIIKLDQETKTKTREKVGKK